MLPGVLVGQKLSGLEWYPNVGEIRNKDLLLGSLTVGKNADTVAGFANCIALAPPLNLTDEDLEFAAQALSESITEPQVGQRKDKRGQVSRVPKKIRRGALGREIRDARRALVCWRAGWKHRLGIHRSG